MTDVERIADLARTLHKLRRVVDAAQVYKAACEAVDKNPRIMGTVKYGDMVRVRLEAQRMLFASLAD